MKLGGDYAIHMHGGNGQLYSFLPGDDLPDWAAARIDNPYTREETEPAEVTDDPEVKQESDQHGDMPPRKGPAATRQAWADYATNVKHIEVDADWKREDIIAAVDAQG